MKYTRKKHSSRKNRRLSLSDELTIVSIVITLLSMIVTIVVG